MPRDLAGAEALTAGEQVERLAFLVGAVEPAVLAGVLAAEGAQQVSHDASSGKYSLR